MQDALRISEFTPRTGLKRTLQPNPYFKFFFYFTMALAVMLALFIALDVLQVTLTEQPITDLGILVASGLTSILLATFSWHTFGLASRDVYHVAHDHVQIDRGGRIRVIRFDDVTSVRLFHIPYLTGEFVLTTKSQGKIVVPASVTRSEYILEALSSHRGPEFLSHEAIENYRRTSLLADHAWNRTAAHFAASKSLLTRYVLIPLLAAFVLIVAASMVNGHLILDPVPFAKAFLLFFGINLMVGMGFYLTSESMLMSRARARLLADPQMTRRAVKIEEAVIRRARIGHMAISAAATSLLMILLINASF